MTPSEDDLDAKAKEEFLALPPEQRFAHYVGLLEDHETRVKFFDLFHKSLEAGLDGPKYRLVEAKHMTPSDFAKEMAIIAHDTAGDPEQAHSRADDLLCEVLRQLGYGAGVIVFKDMDKWYA